MPSRKSPAEQSKKEPQSPPTPRRSSRRLAARHACQTCQGEEGPADKKRKCGENQRGAKQGFSKSTRRSRASQGTTPASRQASSSGHSTTPTSCGATAAVPIAEKTVSSMFRLEGNIMYKKAFQDGIPSVIKTSRLEDALRLYSRAASTADGPNKLVDWSSATKNCGMATKRMAQDCLEQDEESTKTLGLFKESLKHMSQALIRGGEAHGPVWVTKLHDEMEASYYEVLDVTNTMEDSKLKLRELYQVTGFLPKGIVLASAKYHIADILFKESVRFLECGDYKESLKCLHDIHQPVEEALGILGGANHSCLDLQAEDLQLDLKVLKRDTLYHISTAESIQARKCGERLLERIFKTEEFLDMDLVWNVVDWFKQASLKAAELDLEQEAAALSYLGLINQKILFSTTKSKSYYKRCLELVEAAKPKMFTSEEWYKQCIIGFQRIQDVERQRDEAAQQKIKQKILDTLKEEIAALKKANTCASSLLEHVYKHHTPPEEPKFTKKHLEELKTNEKGPQNYDKQKVCKKLLLKTCQDFHPDKIREKKGETDEEKARRKVLMEEIMKMITKYYENVKLC